MKVESRQGEGWSLVFGSAEWTNIHGDSQWAKQSLTLSSTGHESLSPSP